MYRLVIVDDHPAVRDGLTQLFEAEPDFVVCGSAADRQTGAALLEKIRPDLAVIDLFLGADSGLDLIRDIRQVLVDTPILVISMMDDRWISDKVRSAGAQGYVDKADDIMEVVRASRTILKGEACFQNDDSLKTPSGDISSVESVLTKREIEILDLIGRGLKPRHVAERLAVSVSTVEVHRQHLKEKLNIGSAAELTRYAVYWVSRQAGTAQAL